MPAIDCPLCTSALYKPIHSRFDGHLIVECKDCHHHYLNPPLAEKELDALYENYHHHQSDDALYQMLESYFTPPTSPYQQALSYLRPRGIGGLRVLDVGCGPGFFLNACLLEGAQVVGVDRSPSSVRLAKKYFNLNVYTQDIDTLMEEKIITPQSFDVVTAFEVIEHLSDLHRFIQSLKKVLHPQGILILSTPNFELFRLMGKSAPVVTQWPEHLQYFDAHSLAQLAQKNELESLHLYTSLAFDEGAQIKHTLSQKKWIHHLWQTVRKFPGVLWLKNLIFLKIQAPSPKQIEDPARPAQNGLHLMGFFKSPA